MDIAALQHELETLPVEQQDRLAAFLTALRLRREGRMKEISRRLDEKDPSKWVEWDDAKTRLGLDDADSGQ